MKPTDLTPNKIEEAPMGALSKVGNYLGSKLPTFAPDLANRATGNLNTGAVANQAWASYQQYLGQTEGVSAKPTKKSVLAWLKIKKYSPDAINAADQVIDKSETAKTAKTATDAADAKKTADFWHAQYESKKPAHHLDIMRSYLDILSEKTIAEAAPAAALLRPSAPPPAPQNKGVAEASYPGNIGMMEVAKFFNIAKPEEKIKFKRLMNMGKKDIAWQLIQQVTGVKLQGKEFDLVAEHIVKHGSQFRLLSKKGKNLGTFPSHKAAAKHEGEVEYFKAHPKK